MFGPEAAGHATLEEAEADWQRMKMHERQRENGAAAGAGVAADAISAGLEVSFPWAQRLLDGDKTIETREYALPAHWEHKPMALIESNTPASVGEGGFEGAGAGSTDAGAEFGVVRGRIVGTATFGRSVLYTSKAQWAADVDQHCVEATDPRFGWRDGVPKYAWPVLGVRRFETPIPLTTGQVTLEREVRSVFLVNLLSEAGSAEQFK